LSAVFVSLWLGVSTLAYLFGAIGHGFCVLAGPF
jgi:hypothetical protein